MSEITKGQSYKVKTKVNGKSVVRSAKVIKVKPAGRGFRITFKLLGAVYSATGKDFQKGIDAASA